MRQRMRTELGHSSHLKYRMAKKRNLWKEIYKCNMLYLCPLRNQYQAAKCVSKKYQTGDGDNQQRILLQL